MMMMTKEQVYDMAKELRAERVKGRTARYMELLETLYDEDGPTKIFECRQCGEVHCYGDTEIWRDEEILGDHFVCSDCYAESMGEDL